MELIRFHKKSFLKKEKNFFRRFDNGIKKKCIKCCKAMISYMRQIKDRDSIYKYDDILAELEGKQMSQARQEFNESFGEPDESKELGWKPSVTFEEGLERTIDWYLANEEWLKNVTSGAYATYYEKQYK